MRNGDPLLEDYYVRNNVLGLTWHRVWASPLVSTVQATYSGYDGEVLLNASNAPARSNSVRDIQVCADFTYMYQSHDELAFGVQTKGLSTALTLQNVYGVLSSYDVAGTDLHAYAGYRFKRSETFGLTIGVRAKFLTLTENPRVSRTGVSATCLHADACVQGGSGLVCPGGGYDDGWTEVLSVFDPWIIVSAYLSAPSAWHFIAGIAHHFDEHVYLDIEAYYKPMHNLIDINEAKLRPESHDFVNVAGRSYGAEYLVRFDTGSSPSGFICFGPRRTTHNGVIYTPSVSGAPSMRLPPSPTRLPSECNWTLKSGLPFTGSVGFHDRLTLTPASPKSIFILKPVTLWGERNSSRLPSITVLT